jgi:hypothetical protein
MWVKGVGARDPKGARRTVFEDACENACKDAQSAEKQAAQDGDEAPSTLALSRALQTALRTTAEVLRGLPVLLPGLREPLQGSREEASRIGSWTTTRRVRRKISTTRSDSA